MKPTILVTDTLFVSDKYEQRLKDAGFEVVRERGDLSEDELAEALKGKAGYIIGGMEVTTSKVLDSATDLKAIAFTGADWLHFVPDPEKATKMGIKITNTPGSTQYSVSEFTMTLLLMMLRRVFELGGPGKEMSVTTKSLANVHVGIVGLGHIGSEVARMLNAMGCMKVSYWDRHEKPAQAKELGITYMPLEKLFAECDVITNHMSSQAGELLGAKLINSTKDDVLIINTGGGNNFNIDALYERIKAKKARAAFDIHHFDDERFKELPLGDWYVTNKNAAYNTRQMLDKTDDMCTTSLINVLKTGDDQYVVNK